MTAESADRRGVFPTCVGVRPFVTDALAPADGAREAQGAAAGELGGGDPDGRDEALRPRLIRASEPPPMNNRRSAGVLHASDFTLPPPSKKASAEQQRKGGWHYKGHMALYESSKKKAAK